MTDEVTESVESAQPVAAAGNFVDTLPEDLRGEASLQDFKDTAGLAKSYVNAQRMIGNSIRIPGEDASDEIRSEFMTKIKSVPGVMSAPDFESEESMTSFYQEMGTPQKAEDYSVTIPDELELNAEKSAQFKEVAHKLNLSQKQLDGVMAIDNQRLLDDVARQNKAVEDGTTRLKEMWGNDYTNRLNSAKGIVEVYSEKYPEMEALVNSDAGSNPALIAMMAELANSYQETGKVVGAGKVQFGMSSEEARDKISEIKTNKEHPYWSGDRNAVDRVNKLYTIAYDA